jgi:DNA repair protein RecO (recombination protein O)
MEAVILRRGTIGGKRRVVAKGARKIISRLAGHIELFVHAQLMLAVGRSLDIVTQSQVLHSYDTLRTDLGRIGSAYYVAELIDRLTEEGDENPRAFRLLVQAMDALDRTDRVDLALRWFELHLLDSLGYRPQLTNCVVCHLPLTEETSRFSPQAGGAICPSCAPADRGAMPMSLGVFKLLRYLQAQPIEAIDRLSLTPALREEAEMILRTALRHILERDLKSVTFLDEVRQG